MVGGLSSVLKLSELEHYPDNAPLQYQLGCYAARAGRLEDARAHVERAFELNPKAREWAVGDADLESLGRL